MSWLRIDVDNPLIWTELRADIKALDKPLTALVEIELICKLLTPGAALALMPAICVALKTLKSTVDKEAI